MAHTLGERILREITRVTLVIERLQRSAVRAEQAFRDFGAAVRRAKISLGRAREEASGEDE